MPDANAACHAVTGSISCGDLCEKAEAGENKKTKDQAQGRGKRLRPLKSTFPIKEEEGENRIARRKV